jgi:DNA-binding CsgD family transcriptional regulator
MELAERTDILAVLDGMLLTAVSGEGRVAMVTGPVATGKTTLLTTFAERAVDLGGLAVTATGSSAEQGVALGVISQLLRDAPLVDDERRQATDLLREGARTSTTEAGRSGRLTPRLVRRLCAPLLELSRRYPLVLLVDNVDQADQASMVCLSYLARRVRFAPMLALFSRCEPRSPGTPQPEFEESSREPYGVLLPLSTLSPRGVRDLTATAFGATEADRLAPDWHRLSGGNPLLLGGLIEDHRATRDSPAAALPDPHRGEPVPGGHYADAVLDCLRRTGPPVRQVAQAIAVLAGTGSVKRLIHLDSALIAFAERALTAAGVLRHREFAHPVAREAVLSGMDEDERTALYRRAAEIAYHDGAPSGTVAGLLLRAGTADEAWAVPVLEDAARRALRAGHVTTAVDQLRLAWRACGDERRRATIMTTMLRAGWRINPSMSTGYLPALTAALHNGSLPGGDALVLTKALLWNGRFTEAGAVLRQVTTDVGGHDRRTLAELAVIRPLLRSTYPGFAAPPFPSGPPPATTMSTIADGHRIEATAALETVLTRGPSESVIATAERLLHHSGLDEMTLDTVESALLVLTYAGRPDRAAPWCDLFVEEARVRRAPSRLARLAAIRAEVSLRTGELSATVRHARLALESMPPGSWGVAIGGPLASLVTAGIAMGAHNLVREHLDMPVVEEMFQTRYGLHYLQARGLYSLAIGQLPEALRDFGACGDLAAGWGLDVPGLVAWRLDTAETLLRMGRPAEAARLAGEQLDLCGDDLPRVRGMALRLLAATTDTPRRVALLIKAADLLSGDEYEAARTLTDLAEVYEVTGDSRRAVLTAQRARRLAARTGVRRLMGTLRYDQGRMGAASRSVSEPETVADNGPEPGEPGSGAEVLSDAELRVAELAARGHTNREIATRLFITVSTVEQHLTRIYRKLNVSRRTDLPQHLGLDAP